MLEGTGTRNTAKIPLREKCNHSQKTITNVKLQLSNGVCHSSTHKSRPKNPQLDVLWIGIQLTLLILLELIVEESKGNTNEVFLSNFFSPPTEKKKPNTAQTIQLTQQLQPKIYNKYIIVLKNIACSRRDSNQNLGEL